ncbi:hypothetical protein [Faecalicoccus pleomorphus]|uniref:hypothetical protein n=1 Tax=Faecalicoccus pleomorphus TaxID=1323 RepID=UPI00242DAF0B|nr:hypothetical protein [Faecalicoccus pleomorphus]
MAHINCPNGHFIWDGDFKTIRYLFRLNFFKEFENTHPKVKLNSDSYYDPDNISTWYKTIFDYIDIGHPEEDFDTLYCEKCGALVIFVSHFRYDYVPIKKTSLTLGDVKSWEKFVYCNEDDLQDFYNFYDGKLPYQALIFYPFKYKCFISEDQKFLILYDTKDLLIHEYKLTRILDFDRDSNRLL